MPCRHQSWCYIPREDGPILLEPPKYVNLILHTPQLIFACNSIITTIIPREPEPVARGARPRQRDIAPAAGALPCWLGSQQDDGRVDDGCPGSARVLPGQSVAALATSSQQGNRSADGSARRHPEERF
jgi:hypothetical protein